MIEYSWVPATGPDIEKLTELSVKNCMTDVETIYDVKPIIFTRNLTLAVVNQHFTPNEELLSVAKDSNGTILAYTWASCSQYALWSNEKMLIVNMAEIELTLPIKLRIKLVKDMMYLWEEFCKLSQIPIICSTTLRVNQSAFLKLHEREGYQIRGSAAYKRLSTTQATPAN